MPPAVAPPAPATQWEDPLVSSRPRHRSAPVPDGLMLDYQFLGLVALVLAVVTRGSMLPVVALTAVIALVMLAFELSAKWYRTRRPRPAGGGGRSGPPDGELNRWMSAVERVLGSKD